MSVRVRFAPSPTGYLHIGGLRTALFNYLFARKNGSSLILRVEDTDSKRFVPDASEKLITALDFCGVRFDEGPHVGGSYGPYVQSKRLSLYQSASEKLLGNGSAYRCFCSPLRLATLRANKKSRVQGYDNACRNLSPTETVSRAKDEDFCVRLRLSRESVQFEDLIFGVQESDSGGDPVILKSDGWPTYHLANVIDDSAMDISHVMRGEEWLKSTTIHVQLYRALLLDPPAFAHVPLLMDLDGTKLSKRNDSVRVEHYINEGYRPLALVNFVCHYGGGSLSRKINEGLFEIETLEKLTERFDLCHLRRNRPQIDLSLLARYNRACLATEPLQRQVEELKMYIPGSDDAYLGRLVKTLLHEDHRIATIKQLATHHDMQFLWNPCSAMSMSELSTAFETLGFKIALNDLMKLVNHVVVALESGDDIDTVIKTVTHETALKRNVAFRLLRYCLIRNINGPSLKDLTDLFGRSDTATRLRSSVQNITE